MRTPQLWIVLIDSSILSCPHQRRKIYGIIMPINETQNGFIGNERIFAPVVNQSRTNRKGGVLNFEVSSFGRNFALSPKVDSAKAPTYETGCSPQN